MQERLFVFADRVIGMRITDDAVDVARRRDIPAAHIADDDGAAFGCELARIAAEPVVILDRRFDPAAFRQPIEARTPRGSCK